MRPLTFNLTPLRQFDTPAMLNTNFPILKYQNRQKLECANLLTAPWDVWWNRHLACLSIWLLHLTEMGCSGANCCLLTCIIILKASKKITQLLTITLYGYVEGLCKILSLKEQCQGEFYHFWTRWSFNTLIYLQNNIKISRERSQPSFERRTRYGLSHFRSKNVRTWKRSGLYFSSAIHWDPSNLWPEALINSFGTLEWY